MKPLIKIHDLLFEYSDELRFQSYITHESEDSNNDYYVKVDINGVKGYEINILKTSGLNGNRNEAEIVLSKLDKMFITAVAMFKAFNLISDNTNLFVVDLSDIFISKSIVNPDKNIIIKRYDVKQLMETEG